MNHLPLIRADQNNGSWTPLPIAIGLLCFLAMGSWYSFSIPVGEGVDEVPHFLYIKFVKEQHRLPIQPLHGERPLEVWMGHHPPAYYIVTALACGWCDLSDSGQVLQPNPHFVWAENDGSNGWNVQLHDPERERFPFRGTVLAMHYLRLLSVVMSTLTLYGVYRIGRLLLPEQPWVSISALILVGFIPSFLFMSSTIHHDVMMAMGFTLALWWMVRALKQFPTARQSIMGGVLLGIALLTKLTALSLIPLFGVTFLLLALRQSSDRRVLLARSALLFGTAALVAGWWFVRNMIYYGEPLGLTALFSVFTHMARQEPFGWGLFRNEFLSQLSRTFWAAFGYMHITLPWPLQRLVWAVAAALAVLALFAFGWKRRILIKERRWQGWLLLLLAVVLVLISFVRLAVSMRGAGQGRYLFTLAAPVGLLLAVGLHTALGWRAPRLATAIAGMAMLLASSMTLTRFVMPLYAAPERLAPESVTALPAGNLHFDDALRLAAYQWESPVMQPDQSGELTLYWQALGAERPDMYLRMTVRDRYGNPIAEEGFWPAPSYSTTAWSPDDIYATHHRFFLPPSTPLGVGRVELSASLGREGDAIPALTTAGEPLAEATIPLRIGESSVPVEAKPPQIERTEQLGEQIRLIGYDLPSTTVQPGDTVQLTLHWQAQTPLTEDYTVFVQLLNEAGQLVAQQDSQPQQGTYPTTMWQPGEAVLDPYQLMLPEDAPPGAYRLIVGMYRWPSLERLPVSLEGVSQGDAITLDTLSVQRP